MAQLPSANDLFPDVPKADDLFPEPKERSWTDAIKNDIPGLIKEQATLIAAPTLYPFLYGGTNMRRVSAPVQATLENIGRAIRGEETNFAQDAARGLLTGRGGEEVLKSFTGEQPFIASREQRQATENQAKEMFGETIGKFVAPKWSGMDVAAEATQLLTDPWVFVPAAKAGIAKVFGASKVTPEIAAEVAKATEGVAVEDIPRTLEKLFPTPVRSYSSYSLNSPGLRASKSEVEKILSKEAPPDLFGTSTETKIIDLPESLPSQPERLLLPEPRLTPLSPVPDAVQEAQVAAKKVFPESELNRYNDISDIAREYPDLKLDEALKYVNEPPSRLMPETKLFTNLPERPDPFRTIKSYEANRVFEQEGLDRIASKYNEPFEWNKYAKNKDILEASDPMEATAILNREKDGAIKTITDRAIVSARGVLENQGETGKQLATLIDDFESERRAFTGRYHREFMDVMRDTNPSPEEFTLAVDAHEGRIALPESDRIKKIVNILDKQGTELGKEAVDAKVPGINHGKKVAFRPIERGYFPRNYTEEFYDSLNDAKQVAKLEQYLIDTGQAKDKEAVSSLVKQYISRARGTRVGEQYSRTMDVPWAEYSKTPSDWINHIDEFGSRIVQARKFGPQGDSIARSLQNKLAAEGYDNTVASQVLDLITNTNLKDSLADQAWRKVRNIQSVTKLGPRTGWVLNYLQRYNIIPRTNLASYWAGRKAAMSLEGIRWAEETGAVGPRAIKEAMTGVVGDVQSKVVRTMMNLYGISKTEATNRIIASNSGRYFADQMFTRLIKNPNNTMARRMLEDFGINVDEALARGSLTKKELIRASQQVEKDTQFWSGVMDLPVGWSHSGLGKTMTQFKPAAYQQFQFFKNFAVREATKGNVKPLISFLVIAGGTGEIVADVRAGMFGTDRPENPLLRMAENLSYGSGIGIAADVANLFAKGYTTGFWQFLGGPAASSGVNVASATSDILTGKVKSGAKKLIKEVSTTTANWLFPKEDK